MEIPMKCSNIQMLTRIYFSMSQALKYPSNRTRILWLAAFPCVYNVVPWAFPHSVYVVVPWAEVLMCSAADSRYCIISKPPQIYCNYTCPHSHGGVCLMCPMWKTLEVDGRSSLCSTLLLLVVTHCSFPCSADVRRMPVLIINYISDNLHIAVPEYS